MTITASGQLSNPKVTKKGIGVSDGLRIRPILQADVTGSHTLLQNCLIMKEMISLL
jgi:hypothetical protein